MMFLPCPFRGHNVVLIVFRHKDYKRLFAHLDAPYIIRVEEGRDGLTGVAMYLMTFYDFIITGIGRTPVVPKGERYESFRRHAPLAM